MLSEESYLPGLPIISIKRNLLSNHANLDVIDPTDFVLNLGKRSSYARSYDPGEEFALTFGRKKR